jgi:hypothetical protein
MTTNTNIAKRARTTGMPAATHSPALYPVAAERRVACPSASGLNRVGGQSVGRHSFRPEGLRRTDRRQLQN